LSSAHTTSQASSAPARYAVRSASRDRSPNRASAPKTSSSTDVSTAVLTVAASVAAGAAVPSAAARAWRRRARRRGWRAPRGRARGRRDAYRSRPCGAPPHRPAPRTRPPCRWQVRADRAPRPGRSPVPWTKSGWSHVKNMSLYLGGQARDLTTSPMVGTAVVTGPSAGGLEPVPLAMGRPAPPGVRGRRVGVSALREPHACDRDDRRSRGRAPHPHPPWPPGRCRSPTSPTRAPRSLIVGHALRARVVHPESRHTVLATVDRLAPRSASLRTLRPPRRSPAAGPLPLPSFGSRWSFFGSLWSPAATSDNAFSLGFGEKRRLYAYQPRPRMDGW